MIFFNRSNHPEKKQFTPKGSDEMTTYIVELDENGNKIEVENGKTNIYEQIQSHHEGTKIKNILRRAEGGDATALAVTNGQYVDMADAPTSLAQVHNVIKKAEDDFYSLPAELRNEFNNSATTYIKSIGTEEWAGILGRYYNRKAANRDIKPTADTETT